MRNTTQGAPTVWYTWGLPADSYLPISQMKQSRLKGVCDWLESQDENSGLTAQPMLISSFQPPSSLQLALTTLSFSPHQLNTCQPTSGTAWACLRPSCELGRRVRAPFWFPSKSPGLYLQLITLQPLICKRGWRQGCPWPPTELEV